MAKPNRKDQSATRGDNNDTADMPEPNATDKAAGSEGIDDLAMESGRQQGREAMDDASTFSGQGNQREGSPNPEGTGYTGNTGNMSGSNRGLPEGNVVDRTSKDRDRNQPENAENSTTADSEE